MKSLITALVLLLLASVVSAQTLTPIGKWPYVAIVAANSADIASSLYAERHGTHESNPVSFDNSAMIINKVFAAVIDVTIVRFLADHNHPKLAKITAYICAAPSVVVTVHNMQLARH